MSIVLYSTDCPKCKVLEKKLEQNSIEYKVNKDIDKMIAMGIREAPVLVVDGVYFNFMKAVEWVNAKKG